MLGRHRPRLAGWGALWVVVLGGCGLGALNELVEFLISQTVPGTRIGGYENTGWDLVANLVGCLAAGTWLGRTANPPPSPASDPAGKPA